MNFLRETRYIAIEDDKRNDLNAHFSFIDDGNKMRAIKFKLAESYCHLVDGS